MLRTSVSSISGPVLAGFLLWLDPFGLDWRAVFLINVAIGALRYPLSARVLPRAGGDRSVRLDPVAAVLLITGLAATLGGLITAGEREQGLLRLPSLPAGSWSGSGDCWWRSGS